MDYYYSSIKNNNIMELLGKWMEVEIIILSEIIKNKPGFYLRISGYYLLRLIMIQSTNPERLLTKEGSRVSVCISLGRKVE